MNERRENVPSPAFLGLQGDLCRYETARAVVLPAPYERTCSYLPGASLAPAAIIEASPNAEWFDEETGIDLEHLGIATLPPLHLADLEPETMVDAVAEAARTPLRDSKLVAGLGGEHTVSLGFIRAALEAYPRLSVLQIDAHPDLRDTYEERPICHATVGRRLLEMAPLVQVGVRAWSREENDFMAQEASAAATRLTVIPSTEVHSDPAWIEKAAGALGSDVYVTFDVDGLDPSLMPATGTPEPGGLTWRQAADLLARVAETRPIRGFDVVELSPRRNLEFCDYTAARLTARLIALGLAPK